MDTKSLYFLAVIAVCAVITVTNAEVDCKKRPNFKNLKECCPVKDIISEDIMKKCQEKIGMPPPTPEGETLAEDDNEDGDNESGRGHHGKHGKHGHHGHHGHHNPCLTACFINETEILLNGEVQESNLDNFLSSATYEPEVATLLKQNLQECVIQVQEMKTKMAEMKKDGRGPPHHGGRGHHGHHGHCPYPHNRQDNMVLGCAMMKTFMNCPDSLWSGTEECNAAREYFTECKMNGPPGPPQSQEEGDETEE